MGLSRDMVAARALMGDRECPLCGEQAWDFEGARVVFLVDASDGSRLADYRRYAAAGPVLSWGRTSESEAEKAQRWASDQLKPVRTAASRMPSCVAKQVTRPIRNREGWVRGRK